MRRFAFVIMMLGMFVLVLLLNFEPRGVDELDGLEINTRVSVSGLVVSEKLIYSGTWLLELDSGIELICECAGGFEGLQIELVGVVEEYEGRKQIRVLRISEK